MVLSSSLRHFGELQLHDDRLGVLVDVAVRVLIAPPLGFIAPSSMSNSSAVTTGR
jgi:hypothetical protein